MLGRNNRLFFLLAALLPILPSMGQEIAVPSTPAVKLLTGWIEFMNAADDSPANDFNPAGFRDKTAAAKKSRTEFRDRGREIFGSLELSEVLSQKDREIAAVLRGAKGQEIQITLFLTPKPDNLIEAVKLEPFQRGQPAGPQSDSTIKQRATDIMERASARGFSGAVLIARRSDPLFAGAYGLANRSYAVPNTLKTKFNLGSMNKMFTAVAIMQLVESKQLKLTDPLSKHLDESWLAKVDLDKVQIQHLLSHTSGLGGYFNEEFENSSRAKFRSITDYKSLIASDELGFEPGTSWRYSNTGYLLLGAVIEKVTGESYFDYIRKHVYQPAGMTNSDCFELDRPNENLAYGYWKDGDHWRNNLFLHVLKGGPAGGGYSTLGDLLRFSGALTSGKLLSPQRTRQLVTPKPNSPSYGFGFEVSQTPTGLIAGHSGGFPGIESHLSIFLDKGVTLVILCNADNSMSLVLDDLRGLITSIQD